MNSLLVSTVITSLVALGLLALVLALLGILWGLLIGKNRRPAVPRAADGILAPASGTVVAIQVQPGDPVAFGQQLCIYAAGGQTIAVRAARPGIIEAVHVTSGGKINRGQLLMEFKHGGAEGDESHPAVD